MKIFARTKAKCTTKSPSSLSSTTSPQPHPPLSVKKRTLSRSEGFAAVSNGWLVRQGAATCLVHYGGQAKVADLKLLYEALDYTKTEGLACVGTPVNRSCVLVGVLVMARPAQVTQKAGFGTVSADWKSGRPPRVCCSTPACAPRMFPLLPFRGLSPEARLL